MAAFQQRSHRIRRRRIVYQAPPHLHPLAPLPLLRHARGIRRTRARPLRIKRAEGRGRGRLLGRLGGIAVSRGPGCRAREVGCCIYCWAAACAAGLLHLLLGCCMRCWAAACTAGLLHLLLGCCMHCWAAAFTAGLLHLLLGCCIYSWAAAFTAGLLHLLLGCCIWMGCWERPT